MRIHTIQYSPVIVWLETIESIANLNNRRFFLYFLNLPYEDILRRLFAAFARNVEREAKWNVQRHPRGHRSRWTVFVVAFQWIIAGPGPSLRSRRILTAESQQMRSGKHYNYHRKQYSLVCSEAEKTYYLQPIIFTIRRVVQVPS